LSVNLSWVQPRLVRCSTNRVPSRCSSTAQVRVNRDRRHATFPQLHNPLIDSLLGTRCSVNRLEATLIPDRRFRRHGLEVFPALDELLDHSSRMAEALLSLISP
jgi:hypothetical protein